MDGWMKVRIDGSSMQSKPDVKLQVKVIITSCFFAFFGLKKCVLLSVFLTFPSASFVVHISKCGTLKTS